ncbi:MAG TPA: response regulator [Opitutaceae bacterium]|nr:response regulator [Opitutaceae bacterium]
MPHAPGRKILIVDDDVRLRELAEFAARKSGLFTSVLLASNGVIALRLVHELAGKRAPQLPDVVLTDLSMPEMDGLQLTRALKTDPITHDLPIFMFSSSGRPNDRELALAAGCREFFEKPLTIDGLAAIMQTMAGATFMAGHFS